MANSRFFGIRTLDESFRCTTTTSRRRRRDGSVRRWRCRRRHRRCFLLVVCVGIIILTEADGVRGFSRAIITTSTTSANRVGAADNRKAVFRCHAVPFGLDRFFPQLTTNTTTPQSVVIAAADDEKYENGEPSYPWKFTGRCIFVPSLVRRSQNDGYDDDHSGPSILHLGGWTVGGTVALEYDDSPVGYYREWVSLGGLAVYPRRTTTTAQRTLLVGQVGRELYVSRPDAEVLCERVWGLVANRGASIQFVDDDDDVEESAGITLSQQQRQQTRDDHDDSLLILKASGWNHVRRKAGGLTFQRFDVLVWTPAIKAIWAALWKWPVVGSASSPDTTGRDENDVDDNVLPLHRLRLSGNIRPARIDWKNRDMAPQQAVHFGLGLAVEDLVIEISPSIQDP